MYGDFHHGRPGAGGVPTSGHRVCLRGRDRLSLHCAWGRAVGGAARSAGSRQPTPHRMGSPIDAPGGREAGRSSGLVYKTGSEFVSSNRFLPRAMMVTAPHETAFDWNRYRRGLD
jgi:hypothetical protein